MTATNQAAKLADVARYAGVGNATASRALNGGALVGEETRKRIQEAARVLNYHPNRTAQVLKGGRSGMIGMVVPRMSDLFFASCVDAVQAVAVQNASTLVVAMTHDSTDRTMTAIKQLMQHKVDGLVLALSEYLSPAMVRSLKGLPVPVVGIDAPMTKAGLPAVLIDNAESARIATEHLLGHGFRRVVNVQVGPSLYTMRERRIGYEDAMRRAGLMPEQRDIADTAEAEGMLSALRSGKERYALLAGNETAAKYLIRAAKHLNMRMPDDFGMVSFDDFELADAVDTPLTVIHQPVERIGETAARTLFQQVRSDPESGAGNAGKTTVIPAELVVRRSCGCGRAGDHGRNG